MAKSTTGSAGDAARSARMPPGCLLIVTGVALLGASALGIYLATEGGDSEPTSSTASDAPAERGTPLPFPKNWSKPLASTDDTFCAIPEQDRNQFSVNLLLDAEIEGPEADPHPDTPGDITGKVSFNQCMPVMGQISYHLVGKDNGTDKLSLTGTRYHVTNFEDPDGLLKAAFEDAPASQTFTFNVSGVGKESPNPNFGNAAERTWKWCNSDKSECVP
jgi:hypothetical protein